LDNDINNKIQNFLQYVFEMVEDMERLSQRDGGVLACPKCATTYAGFKKSGKMGCARCYDAFRPHLSRALVNIHGSEVHRGKIPRGMGGRHQELVIRRELAENRLMLKKALESEQYEEAARLRDIIHNLEQGGGENEVV